MEREEVNDKRRYAAPAGCHPGRGRNTGKAESARSASTDVPRVQNLHPIGAAG